jgi:membrane glycosyltransferase
MTERPAPEDFRADGLAGPAGLPPMAPLAMPKQALHGPGAAAVVRPLPRPGARVVAIRAAALAGSLAAAGGAFLLFLGFGMADGLDALDLLRAVLILLTTWWLAWGAAQAVAGLLARPARVPRHDGPLTTRTVILIPVYNEDPAATFSRIAAMQASLDASGEEQRFAFAVLSDTRDETVAAAERATFARLLAETGAADRLFYRRRARNTGKKAGNIEDFLRASGAAWDFALILDADSLMEGATILRMVRRMEAAPRLGLLQTLPQVVRARSRFGRVMQFAAALYSPTFARGQAAMQGQAGPFWGHNALVRIAAFAGACGLPDLPGRAPWGGPVLSHDYVEAAMLARAGWQVRLDPDLGGSYEEGPETVIDHAKRDRRWAQGNLQHLGVIGAAGLTPWHRFTLFQGIFAYLAPLFWIAFLAASILAAVTARPRADYFQPHNPVPVFPIDETWKAVALAMAVTALLFLPKLLVAAQTALRGRAAGFGGARALLRSTLAEMALACLLAPVLLMFQARSVVQVLVGRDAGWPAQNRDGGALSLAEALAATRWIVGWAGLGLAATLVWAPALAPWLAPVLGPMLAAPWLVAWLSQPDDGALMATPAETAPSPVLRAQARRQTRGEPAAPTAGGVPTLPLPDVALGIAAE